MAFWRHANPVIKPGKFPIVTKGGMFPTQRACWESSFFYKFLVGGYGSGKTRWLGKRMIALTIMNAPYPCMVVSPTYKMAKRTIIPTIKELLDGKNIKYSYHSSDHYFTIYYNGHIGTLWVGSGNDPDSLKGSNLAAGGIDEPFLQKYEVLTQLSARVREPRAIHSEICAAGTPEGVGGWGYEICEGELKDSYDIGVFRAKTSENLALPQHYLDNLRSTYDKKMLEAYFDGEFVTISNLLVYYNFTDENVIDLPDPGGELCIGLDFNVNPMAGVVFWKHGNRMHYIDEIEQPNSDTETWMQIAHEKYPGRIKKAYPDPTGKKRQTSAQVGRTDFTIIQNTGVEVNAKKQQSVRDRHNATNKKLEDITLTVSPKCKKLIRYFKSSAHDDIDDSMTHLLDGGTYPVAFIFPIHKPVLKARTAGG